MAFRDKRYKHPETFWSDDDMRSALGAACAGNGLAYVFESFATPDLKAGKLERVLPTHELIREAFFLYYPSRRLLPLKLRVFVDWFRRQNDVSGD